MKKQRTDYRIISNQTGVHENCLSIAKKHHDTMFLAPIPEHQLTLFNQLVTQLTDESIILDSGCGTGMSTGVLAKQFPDKTIVGIDKSSYRLSKHPHFKGPVSQISANAWLVHAELNHVWRLLLESNITVEQHFILYPNPWPKDIQKRFHGHPIARTLFSLSARTTVRSNWEIYVDEFGLVANDAYALTCQKRIVNDRDPMTLFEKKYLENSEQCFEVVVG